MLRRDKDAQGTGADSTSVEETHPSPRDGFTPVTQWAEVRRPWQKTNEKWHLSEIPVETCSPPPAAAPLPLQQRGQAQRCPSQPGCCRGTSLGVPISSQLQPGGSSSSTCCGTTACKAPSSIPHCPCMACALLTAPCWW